jgi:hypothetical protein
VAAGPFESSSMRGSPRSMPGPLSGFPALTDYWT